MKHNQERSGAQTFARSIVVGGLVLAVPHGAQAGFANHKADLVSHPQAHVEASEPQLTDADRAERVEELEQRAARHLKVVPWGIGLIALGGGSVLAVRYVENRRAVRPDEIPEVAVVDKPLEPTSVEPYMPYTAPGNEEEAQRSIAEFLEELDRLQAMPDAQPDDPLK